MTPATPTTARAAGSDAPAVPSRLADYKALLKLGIARMVIITTAVGFLLAHRAGYANWSWGGMVGVLAGTGLSCMAASVLNQVWERRTDALMPRTARRPLARPNEPVPVSEALALAAALTLLGQGLVCLCGTPLASGLAAATIVGYVLVYTPLKKRTRAALYLGGIPGAIPPLIGYAAVSGTLLGSAAATAWILFAIMFVWQLPHFLAIGYLYRDDYAAGGMHMHAVLDPTGRSSYQESIVWCVVLLPLGQRRTRTLPYARSPSSCSRKKNSHHPAPDKAVQRAHAHRRRLSATTAGGASTRGARGWGDSLNASCKEGSWSLFSCSLIGVPEPAG